MELNHEFPALFAEGSDIMDGGGVVCIMVVALAACSFEVVVAMMLLPGVVFSSDTVF